MIKKKYLFKDFWLSKQFGYRVYTLKLEGSSLNIIQDYLHNFLKKNKNIKLLICCKIPSLNIPMIVFLEKNNFNLIDTNVEFKIDINKKLFDKIDFKNIRFSQKKDRFTIIKIADKNFLYSRFHLDPNINNKTADKIKREWVNNYFKGKKGHQMITAYANDVYKKPIGFLLLIFKKNYMIIDLIGVDDKYQGKGFASEMIKFAFRKINYETIIVGTQISNTHSIRLYENLGFKLFSSNYIFHYHN